MDKKLMRNIIWLITYSVLLVAMIVKFDSVMGLLQNIIVAFNPLFIGIGIAFVLNGPYSALLRFFEKKLAKKNKKIPPTLAVLSVYVAFIVVILIIVMIIVPQLGDSIKILYSNIGGYTEQLQKWAVELSKYLNIQSFDFSNIGGLLEKIPSLFSGLIPGIFDVTASIASVVTNTALGFIFSVYLLLDKRRIKSQFSRILYRYAPATFAKKSIKVGRITTRTFTKFISGQMTEGVILGVLCFIGMVIFRFEYPLLISVMIAITGLIPIAGAVIGCIPSAFILMMISPMKAVWFIVFIIILQNLEGNLIYPKVVGGSIGLPAIWVLLSVVVGGAMFGVLGMLIGVPVTSVIYQLLKEDVKKQPLAVVNKEHKRST